MKYQAWAKDRDGIWRPLLTRPLDEDAAHEIAAKYARDGRLVELRDMNGNLVCTWDLHQDRRKS